MDMNTKESKMQDDKTLAANLAKAIENYEANGDDEGMMEAENAILDRLNVSGDETEQGLTEYAVEQIEKFQYENGERGYQQLVQAG